ncbi:transcription repressor OFP17-like [Bidens hawaiensis]|uniref:transcription repressor OFP17-like n=1 Tax=Bidens hawaiensis TaxID=980011 RepID=UPI00404A1752
MTTKSSVSTFTYKKLFTTPCKSFFSHFKFKNTILIRRNHSRITKPTTTSVKKRSFCCLTSFFGSLRQAEDMDRVMELKSFSDAGYVHKAPCPSPLTPAYIKMGRNVTIEEDDNDVEDGYQRFESYLVKMVAEEGNMKDLVDVEELLYCWKNLKNPVFMNLASRFYGELCKDMFSSNVDNVDDDDLHNLI